MGEESNNNKFEFCIDRGGTFTDIYCRLPGGGSIVRKLLSVDPSNYKDAPTEGIRRILHEYASSDDNKELYASKDKKIPTHEIASIRMGTTVATNALLERRGAKTVLVVTKGFKHILEIGNQSRPDIFDLTCKKPSTLYSHVVTVNERVVLDSFYNTNNEENNNKDEIVEGITGENIRILQKPDLDMLRSQLEPLVKQEGVTAIAVCLLHAYTFPHHETLIGQLAKELGFQQISLSSQVMPMIKMVPRAHTVCAAAYLTPQITSYLDGFLSGFDDDLLTKVPLHFMKSDGGLSPPHAFGGHEAILSGPAGGVVGYAHTTTTTINSAEGSTSGGVIGFDMGGTSTDVSRYNGQAFEHTLETTTAGVVICAPQLEIATVAAGGGSRLFWHHGRLVVGPESAGAHPGPVCYRKEGGMLAVTDANLILGRILPQEFPHIFGPDENQPLDLEGSRNALQEFIKSHGIGGGDDVDLDELAYGYLQVANEAMCRPIRNLTQMKGFDLQRHVLACFGGAGPQHACAIAQSLGIPKVFVHRHGGILSAYGLSLADAVFDTQEPTKEIYQETATSKSRQDRIEKLKEKAIGELMLQGYSRDQVVTEEYLNMRYDGTDTALMIPKSSTSSSASFQDVFCQRYEREFGFVLQDRPIWIDDVRVRAIVPGPKPDQDVATTMEANQSSSVPTPCYKTRAYFSKGWEPETSVYKMQDLQPGHEIRGPAIIVQSISTVIIELDCVATVTSTGDLEIEVGSPSSLPNTEGEPSATGTTALVTKGEQQEVVQEDPIRLSIFSHRFMGIAEQMGRTLERTAISVNMKERLDFSCALFTADGGLVANAPHIPVHLGAMQYAVKFQQEYWKGDIQEGDVLMSNHPQLAGGSHLPDITVITPVFYNGEIVFFVASRGHHADVGGITPGSMPPHATRLEQEGAMIVAFKLVENGRFREEEVTELLMAPGKLPGNSGTRNLRDNLSDLRAQVAANNSGIRLLQELVDENGLETVKSYMKFIQGNAEQSVRTMLKDFAKKNGTRARAIDHMDDGSPIELTITIDPDNGNALFDFTGTGPQVRLNFNAPPSVTYSAVIYSLRSLVGQDIPLNQGCLAPIDFIIPKYTLLNPSEDAGVVGGNVLTSQRVVDVVLLAFGACAASQGCMNNLTFGDDEFGYYETIAGGSGAGPTWEGVSGIHTHCTNTRITDPEILERRYPVLLHRFELRPDSGGEGKHKGGDGVIRELEPLRDLTMSMLSERRSLRPYGLAGGEPGASGRNLLIQPNGITINMGGRCTGSMKKGDRLRIETPGGGGYGKAE